MVVGTPNSGRADERLHDVVGCLMDVLVMRGDLKGSPSFSDLLDRLRLTVNDALRHSDVPFQYIIDALKLPRDPSRNPMYQVMLNLKDARDVFDTSSVDIPGDVLVSSDLDYLARRLGVSSSGSSLHDLVANRWTSKLDLTLTLLRPADPSVMARDGLAGHLEFSSDLFDKKTAENMMSRFVAVLECAVAEPSKVVWDLPLLSAKERQMVLVDWNDTATPLPKPGRLLHELFLDQVESTPEGLALMEYDGEKRSVTYRELKDMANRVARRLRSLGVGSDSHVGLLMTNDSAEAIAAIMGVLMAGGAYVPLDPGYPAERISLIEKDAEFKAMLVRDAAGVEKFGEVVDCPTLSVVDVMGDEIVSGDAVPKSWQPPSESSGASTPGAS